MRTPTDDLSDGPSVELGRDQPVFGPELGEFEHSERRAAQADGEGEMKTGTTTVGIRAGDGVVMATDMRASLGGMVSSKDVQKVEEIHPRGALTIAGSVSAAQNLISTLKAETSLYETRRGKDMSMEALSTLTGNLLRTGAFSSSSRSSAASTTRVHTFTPSMPWAARPRRSTPSPAPAHSTRSVSSNRSTTTM